MIPSKKLFIAACFAGLLASPSVLSAKAPICDQVGRSVGDSIHMLLAQPSMDPGSETFMNALAQTLVSHLGPNCDCIEEIAGAAYMAVDPDNSSAIAAVSGRVDNKITDTILEHCGSGYAGTLAQIFDQVRGDGDVYGGRGAKNAVMLIAPVAPSATPFNGDVNKLKKELKEARAAAADDVTKIIRIITTLPPVSPSNRR
jgi:hypothetical protein